MDTNFNLHTHTSRCEHAVGLDEDYVKSAIKAGFKTLGFSDHAFFPNIVHKGMRGDYKELDNYISSINDLKKKYKDQIDIKLGFETEYQENFYSFYRFLIKEKGFDFLILGQHVTYNAQGDPIYYFKNNDDIDGIKRYKDDLIKGMKTGLFLYVCHPDLFMCNITKITPEIEEVCREICKASVEYNLPLEINLGELRREEKTKNSLNHHYPDPFFWKIASEYGVSCIIGIDAHSPNDLENNNYLQIAFNLIKENNLKLLNDVKMINLNYLD